MRTSAMPSSRERGSGLIIIIMIVAFMLAVGLLLLAVTGTSPKASDSLRLQGLAFDAAEAGFNAAWAALNDGFNSGLFSSFAGHYHSEYGGIADQLDTAFLNSNQPNPTYFRALTDEQLVQDCLDHPEPNILFNSEALDTDPRCTYTVFLVNDEPPGTVAQNDNDAILVCIGRGPRNTYKRLEIVLECPQ
jgi:Tfp pilus assembly protein PilX